MAYDGPPMKGVTDDFVESYADQNYSGVFSRMCIICGVPAGVDQNDPRVKEILQKICDAQGLKAE